jgi:hypothetical protein
LYLAWKFRAADDASAERVWNRLSLGERQHLFRLRSGVVVNGEARALVAPLAPLESIAAAIGELASEPVVSRWIGTESACVALSREIESVPVHLGLAPRPEQWPLSSAAAD